MTVKLEIKGMDKLLSSLRNLPDVMQRRVILPAIAKAAKTVEQAIRPLVPMNNKSRMRRGKSGKLRINGHYRDNVTSVVRDYASTAVAVIGPASGKAPHAHLVEKGTAVRYTNSKTRYTKEAIGTKQVRKKGNLQTVSVWKKVSAGSFKKKNKKPQAYRGRMPAFHSVERGVSASSSAVASQLAADVTSGIANQISIENLLRGGRRP